MKLEGGVKECILTVDWKTSGSKDQYRIAVDTEIVTAGIVRYFKGNGSDEPRAMIFQLVPEGVLMLCASEIRSLRIVPVGENV